MFGISDNLTSELRIQSRREQWILIPKSSDTFAIVNWLLENIGTPNSSNPNESNLIDGFWYVAVVFTSRLYLKIWVRDPNDRTLVKLTWS